MKKVDLSEDEKIAYRQQQLRNLHRQSRGVNMGLAASPSQGNNRRNSLVPTGLQRRGSSWRLMPGSNNLVGGNASRHGLRGSGGSTGGGVRKLVPPSRDTFSKPKQDLPGSQAFSTDSGDDDSDDGKSMDGTDSPSNRNADSLDNYGGSTHNPPPPPPLPEEGEGGAADQTATRREEIPAPGNDRDENTKRIIREQRRRQQEDFAVPQATSRSPHKTTSPHADDNENAKRSIRDQRIKQLQPLPPSDRVTSSGSYSNSSTTHRDDTIKQSLLNQRNSDTYAGMQPLPPAGGRATSNGSHQDDSIKNILKAERQQRQQQEPRTASSSSVSMSSARSSTDNIKQRLREERNQNSFSSFDNNNSSSSSINFPPTAAVTAALEGSEPLPNRYSNKARDAGYCDPYEPPSAAPTKSETRPLPPERQQSQQQFAMKSIERGSDDWNALLQPFVSDLCYQSVVSKRTQKSITFRPRPCQAALLFVDLSGYSKITSALAYAGAHAISACVNSYLSRLVRVLRAHGGDCVKFAGDAIMVVWAGQPHELEINVYCAARAALILQAECGNHPVPGTDHQFQIHCGLAAGTLHSEVFCAPKQNRSMPRLYHVLSGETVQEIGDLVDLAASGELCVSSNCVSFLEGSGRYRHISDQKLADNGFHTGAKGAKLLVDLVVTAALTEYMDDHIANKKQEIAEQRQAIVNSTFAEDFIHSSVLDALQHGGLSPTQIAQMRELCVLFIAMTSTGDAVNWLIEVQEILDRNRCPIVQIIHDDKGVHIVAAINLYEAVPETPLVGLKVCRELANKRVGAAVGMAIGPSFCGVTGSVEACRWDITGPAVVRAARLMQYALARGVDFAIDQTVYADPDATTYMTVVDSNVMIKGTRDPCVVYTISDSELHSTSRIMSSDHVAVHQFKVETIQGVINSKVRSAVVITGAPLVGKKIVCQRAAGLCGMVPYLHRCDIADEFAALARTIATWFRYATDKEMRDLAQSVLEDMDNARWTCAHGQCIQLVNMAVEKGFRTCFVVDRIQYLDQFSLSLICECLQGQRTSSYASSFDGAMPKSSMGPADDSQLGKICFLCLHIPLFGSKSASEIREDITKSLSTLYVEIVEIGPASREDLGTLFRHICDLDAEDRLLDCYAESSGYAAGYFVERVLGVLSVGGESLMVETNSDFKLQVPSGMIHITKELSVTQICPQIATRFSQVYDELPLLCQFILKTVAVANKDYSYPLKQGIVEQVINKMMAQGIEKAELDELIDELIEIRVLKVQDVISGGKGVADREITIQSPALADIAIDVCTPTQFESIASALVDCLQNSWTENFKTALVCASLHDVVTGNEAVMKQMWRQAFYSFLCESEGWPKWERNKWIEAIGDAIRAAGFAPKEVLGEDISVPCPLRMSIPSSLSMLKTYAPPISLGPLGVSLSVICRNLFREFGKFCGSGQGEQVLMDLESACNRYLVQVSILEEFLRQNLIDENQIIHDSSLESEFEMLTLFCNPSSSREDTESKATLFLDQMIPNHIKFRRQRLVTLVRQLRGRKELPALMEVAPKPLRLAYEALQVSKSRSDAAQDALMILATSGWMPQPSPEHLPAFHNCHQSIANLRDQTLKELSEAEDGLVDQLTVDDLEAFLVVTALLYQED